MTWFSDSALASSVPASATSGTTSAVAAHPAVHSNEAATSRPRLALWQRTRGALGCSWAVGAVWCERLLVLMAASPESDDGKNELPDEITGAGTARAAGVLLERRLGDGLCTVGTG
ncbi:hypothetical protein GCM10010191_89450 [Actinomadura vinacea]|uniref:Uncharacterized protein n=1 Tax=Actinomadura vinacea TaxID=115336 RepID=A0ABP5XIW0_9ACTN